MWYGFKRKFGSLRGAYIMDEKEFGRLKTVMRALAKELNSNRAVTHMSAVYLHLHSFTCGHTDTPHICVCTYAVDPQAIAEANANIPQAWQGIQVYIQHGIKVFPAKQTK